VSSAREQVSRLLALVPYLQSRTDVALTQVAADFAVTPDQIRKDLGVLWMCGLPGLTPDKMIDVDMEAIEDDPEGVVRIENAEYLARPVRLGSSEASALIVALRALREGSPESSHEVIDRCLVKLEDAAATGTAPPQVQVHLPQTGHRTSAHLTEAIDADRQVRLDYYVPTRDETTRRTVDPLALLTSVGRDYLDAWCHHAQARRLFRLDRMHAVEVLDEPRLEHQLAPRDLAEGLFEPGPHDLEAVVHLERHARWVADYYPVDAVEELGEGRLAATLRVGDPRWLVRLALRLAPAVTVVEPARLREEVQRTARATLGLYAALDPGAQFSDATTPARGDGVR
jgi:proteasome accessory factor C